MPLTINLNDNLATRLIKQASSSQLPAEALAAKLLGDALAQLDKNDAYSGDQNRRRLALIRKSVRVALSKAEQAELEALQVSLDRQLESVDDQLLNTLGEMHQSAKELSQN